MPSVTYSTQPGVTFRKLATPGEHLAAAALRFQYICIKMGWVEGDPELELEQDEYDLHSDHFGAFDGPDLVGCMRMTLNSSHGFMTKEAFGSLLADPAMLSDPPEQTADISRLCLAPSYQKVVKALPVMLGLYAVAYAEAQVRGIRYWYFATNRGELAVLRRSCYFPVEELGKGITTDGKWTSVCRLDLVKTRQVLERYNPDLLEFIDKSGGVAAK